MKFGVIWFLHLDIPIQFARIAVILCFIVGFVVPIDSPLFIIAWILFAVCLLITVCTFFMHIPANQRMEKFISQYESDFQEKQKAEFRNYKNAKITTLQCFSNNKSIKLNRWIGNKRIYSSLVMLALIETQDEVWLICDEQSLMHSVPNNTKRYKISTIENVKIEKGTADENGEITWSLQIADERFGFICKEDYHLRDFLNYFKIQ